MVQGICELCVSDQSSLLALPSSAQSGTLRVYDVLSSDCSLLTEINAHKTSVVELLSPSCCHSCRISLIHPESCIVKAIQTRSMQACRSWPHHPQAVAVSGPAHFLPTYGFVGSEVPGCLDMHQFILTASQQ